MLKDNPTKKCCANCKHNSGSRHDSACAIGNNQNKTSKPYYMVSYKRCAEVINEQH